MNSEKKIIIFGNTDFARMIKYYLEEDTKEKVVAFTVEKEFITDTIFCGLKVIPFETIEKEYNISEYKVIIAIGNKRMNRIRENIFNKVREKGYEIINYIHSSCIVNTKEIGCGNIILANTIVYPYTKIGNGNLIWDNVVITHDDELGNFNTLCSGTNLCGYVKIGNNCFFGKNSVVKEYVKIADYSLIGANAFVDKDTKKETIIVPSKSYELKNKKSIEIM